MIMAHKRLSDKILSDSIKEHSGLLTHVAESLGYSYMQIHRRVKKSEKLQQVLAETIEFDCDMSESIIKKAIYGEVISGKRAEIETRIATAKYYLRTKGKGRGYVEETNINLNQTMNPDLPNDYRKLFKLKYGHYPEDEQE